MFCRIAIVICLLLVVVSSSRGQGMETVYAALKGKKAGRPVRQHHAYRISTATYLGNVTGNDNRVIYFIVKEFYEIHASSTYHGHSRILFFDAGHKFVTKVNVDVPEELPFKLQSNVLYFRYTDRGKIKIKQEKLGRTLPAWIFPIPHGCFELGADQ